ncbi:hypothetical protein EYR40_009568 [Pleurotus pulmonarius]|nr:hypothetical protein EYR38_009335 [Pleurotus pulmonarius]KAF4590971.1 hypothetical protein EYR40_009568 [Pleurotus pulmonarius]
MSEARPRPRPRPKPKAKALNNTANETTAQGSSSTFNLDDEDALFMRNTSRTLKDWKVLEQLDERASAKTSRALDSDDDGSPKRKARKRKSEEQDHPIPRWERDQDIIRFLSEDPDLDSDNDIEIVDHSPRKGSKRIRKSARSRSRSKSITPPPDIPLHQLINARNVVRQALAPAPRPASPTAFDPDESTDTIILAPELAMIAKTTKSQASFSQISPGNSFPPTPHATGSILISVRWTPHPLNASGKAENWAFKMNRDDTFHVLFDSVADSANVLVDSLRVSYKGVRLFASVTADALEMPPEAELVACDRATFEYLRNQSLPSLGGDVNAPMDEEESTAAADKSNESDAESEASQSDTFKLIIRSKLTKDKDITLTVRPTTKCGAIVKAFLKKAGLSEQYPSAGEVGAPAKPQAKNKKGSKAIAAKNPKLSIDGDEADNGTQIEDFDLEDGDQVEVVGL